MDLAELKKHLYESILTDAVKLFGITNEKYLQEVTDNWFDDKNNYDGRWQVIESRFDFSGPVLDMAAGCGTFVINGLHRGHQVFGIEPEVWKNDYFQSKIKVSGYPSSYLNHLVPGVGEKIPFQDETFSLITTYQTLEHVTDVEKCIIEFFRVLKIGGSIYLRAPDYSSFFEAHYRIPFLPKFNKKVANIYLKFLGRPTAGLETINYVTRAQIIRTIKDIAPGAKIEDLNHANFKLRKSKISKKLPEFLRADLLIFLLNIAYEAKLSCFRIFHLFSREKTINLWITRSS